MAEEGTTLNLGSHKHPSSAKITRWVADKLDLATQKMRLGT